MRLVAIMLVLASCGRMDFDPLNDATTSSASSWADRSWHYRRHLAIPASRVSADLASFPVMVSTTLPGVGQHARADGADIFFTSSDALTRIPHELERYTTAGDLVAWVNVPQVSAASPTDFYMYYGNPLAPAQQDAAATWANGYRGVWHMAETPTIDVMARDSTANHNDATFNGPMMPANQVPGSAGNALDFNGVDEYLSVPTSASLTFLDTPLSVEAWVDMRNASAFKIAAKGPTRPPVEYYFRTGGEADDLLYMRTYDVSGNYVGRVYTSGLTPYQNQRIHVAATYDGSRLSSGFAVYLEGVRVDNADAGSGVYTGMVAAGQNLDIGRYVNGGYANGSISELRISAGVRTPEWINAAYQNVSTPDAFVGIGPEETAL